jgi:D-amino-acid dehydrogenase
LTASPAKTPRSDSRADVIVIGAGVIGLAVAYYLLRSGARVTILEQGDIGAGSSWGNAGLVVPSYNEPLANRAAVAEGLREVFNPEGFFALRLRPDPHLFTWLARYLGHCTRRHYDRAVAVFNQLSRDTLRLHRQLAEAAAGAYTFQQAGVLYLYRDRDCWEAGRQTAGNISKAGFRVRELSPSELGALVPAAAASVIGGIHYRDDAGLNPALFLQWLAGEVKNLGGDIRTQTEVYGLENTKRRVTGVLTTGGKHAAEQIVLAGGVWLRRMGRWLKVRLPVEGGKGISMTIQQKQPVTGIPLILAEAHAAVSPLGEDLRITGLLELCGLDMTLDPRRIRGISRAVRHYLPAMGSLDSARVWRGLRPCMPDGMPMLGRLATPSNVLVAGGHDTKGVSLAPVTGRLMADLLGGKAIPAALQKALSPRRFQ